MIRSDRSEGAITDTPAVDAPRWIDSFLLKLSDAIGPLTDPAVVQRDACRIVGEHLGVDRVCYVVVDPQRHAAICEHEYLRGEAHSLAGSFPLESVMPFFAGLREGVAVVVDTVDASPFVSGSDAATCRTSEVAAFVCAPILKDGVPIAAMAIASPTPRQWTPYEVTVLVEAARRTSIAVAHARADAALRDTGQRLQASLATLEQRMRERTDDLDTSNQSLRLLLKRLVSVQEDERRRVARDMHDQLGQALTALRLQLEILQQYPGLPAAATHLLNRVQEVRAEIDRNIDGLISQLRPFMLDDLGLSPALGRLVAQWSGRFGVEAEYRFSGPDLPPLESDVETHLYDIAREALHNVQKHARASHVSVLLQHTAGALRLLVEDNGRGIGRPAVRTGSRRLGLVNMRERAALAGGTCDIESSSSGTLVRVTVPVSPRGPA